MYATTLHCYHCNANYPLTHRDSCPTCATTGEESALNETLGVQYDLASIKRQLDREELAAARQAYGAIANYCLSSTPPFASTWERAVPSWRPSPAFPKPSITTRRFPAYGEMADGCNVLPLNHTFLTVSICLGGGTPMDENVQQKITLACMALLQKNAADSQQARKRTDRCSPTTKQDSA